MNQRIVEEAALFGLSAKELAQAVDFLWSEEAEYSTARAAAIRAARQATGLTPSRIARWEEWGRDHSTFPHLDKVARELAGSCPELGIGGGYDSAGGYDDTDYAGRLWEVLKTSARAEKYTGGRIRQAAEMAARTARLGQKYWDRQARQLGLPVRHMQHLAKMIRMSRNAKIRAARKAGPCMTWDEANSEAIQTMKIDPPF